MTTLPLPADLPHSPGTYALLLSMQETACIRAGALGSFPLLPGHYVYIGSAMGPGGLRGRLAHHLRPALNPHWHIDYLRHYAQLEQIWYTYSIRCEHAWAAAFQSIPGCTIPILGFGASDCRCPAHLFYFDHIPELEDIQRRFACLPIMMVPNLHTSRL